MKPQDARALREDFGLFAKLGGRTLYGYQLAAAKLTKRTTVIVSPRQVGKSVFLGILACWWAFAHPGHVVLIVSASEESAKRIVTFARAFLSAAGLAASVVGEGVTSIELTNGARIMSVPTSERTVRGITADLVLIDEASGQPDSFLEAAVIPTTVARPNARIVMVSSPWGARGLFYRMHLQGLDPKDPHVETHVWKLADCPHIAPEVVEAMRSSMDPIRAAAELDGLFVVAGDLFLDPAAVMAVTAPYVMLDPADADGEPVTAGWDWGRMRDAHAVALVGVLDDFGVNP